MVDIYLNALRLGIYPPLLTSTWGDSCILFRMESSEKLFFHYRQQPSLGLCIRLIVLTQKKANFGVITFVLHVVFVLMKPIILMKLVHNEVKTCHCLRCPMSHLGPERKVIIMVDVWSVINIQKCPFKCKHLL